MRLPNIIEWTLPLVCTLCGNKEAHSTYRSIDGEEIYLCLQCSRTNVIRIDLPTDLTIQKIQENELLETTDGDWILKEYEFMGCIKNDQPTKISASYMYPPMIYSPWSSRRVKVK